MDPRKKLRTLKQSGPIRISDHIRDWYIHPTSSQPLTEAEIDYVEKYEMVARHWVRGERFLYDGDDEIPEMSDAFFAMSQYAAIADNNANQKAQGQKQPFDF